MPLRKICDQKTDIREKTERSFYMESLKIKNKELAAALATEKLTSSTLRQDNLQIVKERQELCERVAALERKLAIMEMSLQSMAEVITTVQSQISVATTIINSTNFSVSHGSAYGGTEEVDCVSTPKQQSQPRGSSASLTDISELLSPIKEGVEPTFVGVEPTSEGVGGMEPTSKGAVEPTLEGVEPLSSNESIDNYSSSELLGSNEEELLPERGCKSRPRRSCTLLMPSYQESSYTILRKSDDTYRNVKQKKSRRNSDQLSIKGGKIGLTDITNTR